MLEGMEQRGDPLLTGQPHLPSCLSLHIETRVDQEEGVAIGGRGGEEEVDGTTSFLGKGDWNSFLHCSSTPVTPTRYATGCESGASAAGSTSGSLD